MSATNHTANIELPIFVGDDKPAWLTDWNGAMTTIDGAVGTAQTDISGISATVSTQGGQISSLTTTVGNHTTSISALTDATTHNAGDINTINSLIGNGTPTTTDQTIIGAINELHADQGDLDDLTTTNKSSLVAAINEAATGAQVDVPSLFTRERIEVASVTADGVKTAPALICDAVDILNAKLAAGGEYEGKKVFMCGLRIDGMTDPAVVNMFFFDGAPVGATGISSKYVSSFIGYGTSTYREAYVRMAPSSGWSQIDIVEKAFSDGAYTQIPLGGVVPAQGSTCKIYGYVG